MVLTFFPVLIPVKIIHSSAKLLSAVVKIVSRTMVDSAAIFYRYFLVLSFKLMKNQSNVTEMDLIVLTFLSAYFVEKL